MKESAVWTWLDNHRPSWLAIERIEVLYPPGLSDCFWTDQRSRPSISGWLELKYCEPNNKEWRAGRIPKLKPEQPMFMSRQARKGVPAGILLRVGNDSWHLWRADKSNEWVNAVRSAQAKDIMTASWLFSPDVFSVEAVISYLMPL